MCCPVRRHLPWPGGRFRDGGHSDIQTGPGRPRGPGRSHPSRHGHGGPPKASWGVAIGGAGRIKAIACPQDGERCQVGLSTELGALHKCREHVAGAFFTARLTLVLHLVPFWTGVRKWRSGSVRMRFSSFLSFCYLRVN